ncbi:MAG: peptidoglycan-associated lipoprotein Pal [Azoarcus sp.]|jgi:peptidoglycan-associated lipoprotein|nr:peptidoglycan-associated lipoprotein Pal [Azoarcus sp.]
MKKLLLPALLTTALAACSSDPATNASVGDNVDGNNNKVESVNVQPNAGGRSTSPELSGLSQGSVYFDYDSFVIRAEGRPVINSNARYLNQNRGTKVLIQGNTDERGSHEYNLALGQKRANAVRQALKLLGVRDEQVEAVSLGKEKPRCFEVSESCYAQNRRGDFNYQ